MAPTATNGRKKGSSYSAVMSFVGATEVAGEYFSNDFDYFCEKSWYNT